MRCMRKGCKEKATHFTHSAFLGKIGFCEDDAKAYSKRSGGKFKVVNK